MINVVVDKEEQVKKKTTKEKADCYDGREQQRIIYLYNNFVDQATSVTVI